MQGGKLFFKRAWWVIPVALVLIVAIVFFVNVSVYYHADEVALAAMCSTDDLQILETDYGWLFDGPSEEDALIFYPGGKVDARAYAPLLSRFARAGVDVCLVKMPFRLAIFDANAAEKVMQSHGYARYYLGGHSLGGAMAARYAASHGDELAGLILLGAYPTESLPADLVEILIVGSEDRVVNRSKIEKGREFASSRYYEESIEGGNHAQFGSYGAQKGDGLPSISATEQIEETVRIVLDRFASA